MILLAVAQVCATRSDAWESNLALLPFMIWVVCVLTFIVARVSRSNR